MKQTEARIIKGALEVFLDKGFLQATTQEIAKKAEVAEVTLFRKFKNKQSLFEFTITHIIADTFDASHMAEIYKQDEHSFLKTLITNRLEVINEHQALFKLIIAESIREHLPKDLQFTEVIYSQLKTLLEHHYIYHHKEANIEIKARLIAGFLLSEVILPSKNPVLNHLTHYIKVLTTI